MIIDAIPSFFTMVYNAERILHTLEDIKKFFKESDNMFTIYVVEQLFAVERGAEFFQFYKGKPNFIDTNANMRKRIGNILRKINKHVPDTTELIKTCFGISSPLGLLDVITILSKLFCVNEHQAAGPDVIDPIIIQEGDITPKYINQIISLHKSSILRPVIIILLKDNDFDRAKTMLSGCPHNTLVKMIKNSGETELYKVLNCGVDNPDDFLDAFACQCFSTCSNTKRDILCNEEWAEDSFLKLYSPQILRLRTNLLFRDKTLAKSDINNLITELETLEYNGSVFDQKLIRSFECILKLFRLFCNDGGTQDISDALNIAQELNNDILLAHVYRNAYFLKGIPYSEKLNLMDKAYDIFSKSGLMDHAIYSKNNKLVRQFDTDTVSVYDFLSLQEEAIYNVPGLVGMSHILNNTGAALLISGHPDQAIEYFNKGLDYAYRPERSIQRIALLSNRLIAKAYCFDEIKENELKIVLNQIFDNKEVLNLPFLSARYALNIVSVGFSQNPQLGHELLTQYPVGKLIQDSLNNHKLGSGQLLIQAHTLMEKYGSIDSLSNLHRSEHFLEAMGIRKNFIIKSTYNPCSFSTWF